MAWSTFSNLIKGRFPVLENEWEKAGFFFLALQGQSPILSKGLKRPITLIQQKVLWDHPSAHICFIHCLKSRLPKSPGSNTYRPGLLGPSTIDPLVRPWTFFLVCHVLIGEKRMPIWFHLQVSSLTRENVTHNVIKAYTMHIKKKNNPRHWIPVRVRPRLLLTCRSMNWLLFSNLRYRHWSWQL